MLAQNLKQPHFKTVVFASYIKILRRKYPAIDIAALVAEAGLSLEYISNENNWVSVEFEKRFMNLVVERTGQTDICYEAGTVSSSKEGLGTTLHALVANTIPINTVYSSIPRLSKLFNTVTEVEMTQIQPGRVELQIRARFSDLSPAEADILRERMPAIIENTRGYLSAIPTIKGLPPAQVSAELIDEQKKIYRLTALYLHAKPLRKRTVLQLALVSLSVTGILSFNAWLSGLPAFMVTVSLFSSLSAFILWRRNRGLAAIAVQTEDSLYRLDLQYKEIFNSQTKLRRKFEESKAIYELVAQLISAENEQQVLQIGCGSLVENLKYDRTFILLADTEEKHLRLAADRGLTEKLRNDLGHLRLPIEVNDDDPAKLTNVFRFKSPLLVQSVADHLRQLDDHQSVLVLKNSGSMSFVATPIATKKDKYGILVADCIDKKMTMTEDDLRVLNTCANQIAIALEQQRSRKLLEQAFDSQRLLAQSYARFVPFEMIEMMGYHSVFDVKIGAAIRVDVAIMFTDIVGFTTIAESTDSQDVLKFLNSYYSRIEPIVTSERGSLNKYQGDAIMAIFPSAESAVNAALKIQRAIFQYNLENRRGVRKPVRAGIGIAAGSVVFGPLGSDMRQELTAIGDVVNTAARLDGLCREKDEDILIFGVSQSETDKIPACQRKSLGALRVKGKEIPIVVDAVFDREFVQHMQFHELESDQKEFVRQTLQRWEERKETFTDVNAQRKAS